MHFKDITTAEADLNPGGSPDLLRSDSIGKSLVLQKRTTVATYSEVPTEPVVVHLSVLQEGGANDARIP